MVNQNSSNSCALANYYCERRHVPAENVLRIDWVGDNISWNSNQFQTNLVGPLLNMLSERQLTNQIDYVVLSMDIPFQTANGAVINGTTSALFYGVKGAKGAAAQGSTNSYAGSEQVFANARPASAPGYSFLTTMLTGNSLAGAVRMVDQGVAGDGANPGQVVMLGKSSDLQRNIRYRAFDNAIFNLQLCRHWVLRTNTDDTFGLTNLLGYQTGLGTFDLSPNTFVPGAMADSMTSFGGVIFGTNDQTTALAFLNAGASGSYGTVAEPSPDPTKFPDPQNYFYQARGFSLAECYYQSLATPYQGLVVGEPLAAPFSKPASGGWMGIISNAVLSGTAQLGLQFAASGFAHPVQQVDLFIDGKYFQTLTNLGPAPGNRLTVTLNGYPASYTVPSNATIASVAGGLASGLNALEATNATKVVALVHGDRIELRSTSTNRIPEASYFIDSAVSNGIPRFYRTAYLPQTPPPELSMCRQDASGAFRLRIDAPGEMPSVVEISSNLLDWLPAFTNFTGGSLDFVDRDCPAVPRRFYRIAGIVPDQRPRLYAAGQMPAGGFKVRVETLATAPYVIQASVDLAAWNPILTNSVGGSMEFVDTAAPQSGSWFYRAWMLPQPAEPPAVTGAAMPNGDVLLRVEGAPHPYVVQASTDLIHWFSIATNLALGSVQVGVGSSIGDGVVAATFLTAARDALLDSSALGSRQCSLNGSVQIGTWVELTVSKINGAQVRVSTTNQSGTTILQLAQQLVDAINGSAQLQGSDGVTAEDLKAGWFGSAVFNVRARAAGYRAAGTQIRLTGADSLVLTPDSGLALDESLSDLQPRDNLYVTAGATNLSFFFTLDTTALPDGFHDLTAVAYEGSHVRTQTPVTVPVRIQNSSLATDMLLFGLGDVVPLQGSYPIQLTANRSDVSAIRLWSTGGVIGAATNQTALFALDGPSLGAGLHPIYATVETVGGLRYRTETRWIRLMP